MRAILESGGAGLLLDANNYLVVLLVITSLLYFGKIRPWLALALALSGAAPFVLNDVLFPATYMPDQFLYTRGVAAIRSVGFDAVPGNNTGWASRMLALIPIPFVETVRSLGFANKLIYTVGIVWMSRRYVIPNFILFFMLLYPSIVLYTGLSLRDTLIMTFMIASVILAIEGRRLLSYAILVPLTAIKFQNGLILGIVLILYTYYSPRHGKRSILLLMTAFGVGIAAFFALSIIYLDLLNFYRVAMVVEDGGRPADVEPITGGVDLISDGLANALYFLMKPFPWEAEGALQLVQSIENTFIAGFLTWVTWRCAKVDSAKTLFWGASLFFAFAVYGLVVANFGTAARYRFPFIVIYVLALAADVGLLRRAASRGNPYGSDEGGGNLRMPGDNGLADPGRSTI